MPVDITRAVLGCAWMSFIHAAVVASDLALAPSPDTPSSEKPV